MSKIKLALDVVEGLKDLADSIESLVKAMEGNEEETAASEVAASSVQDKPKEETITTEMVRAALAEKSQAGKQQEIKALITKYGGNKLTDLDPSCYKELLKEAEVL
jgi:hypothetical protein